MNSARVAQLEVVKSIVADYIPAAAGLLYGEAGRDPGFEPMRWRLDELPRIENPTSQGETSWEERFVEIPKKVGPRPVGFSMERVVQLSTPMSELRRVLHRGYQPAVAVWLGDRAIMTGVRGRRSSGRLLKVHPLDDSLRAVELGINWRGCRLSIGSADGTGRNFRLAETAFVFVDRDSRPLGSEK